MAEPSGCHWHGNDLILTVRVQPRASRERISLSPEGEIRVVLTAPPVDGAANEALQKILSKTFGVTSGRVRILQGEHSRNKRILIQDPERSCVERFFQQSGPGTP